MAQEREGSLSKDEAEAFQRGQVLDSQQKSDQEFFKRIDRASLGVARVCEFLHRDGLATVQMPEFIRPDVSVQNKYRDNGDLYVAYRAEVKWRTFSFTCAEDFPYKDPIVCRVNAYQNARPKPTFFYFLDDDASHVGIVNVPLTFKHWYERPFFDKAYGITSLCYVCPGNLVLFRATDDNKKTITETI